MRQLARARAWIGNTRRQWAQAAVEYAVLLALLAVTAIAGLIVIGPKLNQTVQTIAQSVDPGSAPSSGGGAPVSNGGRDHGDHGDHGG